MSTFFFFFFSPVYLVRKSMMKTVIVVSIMTMALLMRRILLAIKYDLPSVRPSVDVITTVGFDVTLKLPQLLPNYVTLTCGIRGRLRVPLSFSSTPPPAATTASAVGSFFWRLYWCPALAPYVSDANARFFRNIFLPLHLTDAFFKFWAKQYLFVKV